MPKRPKYRQNASGVYTPIHDEDQLQIKIVHMMKIDFLEDDLMFCHCPNGGDRDVRTAVKLKAMGVLPGISDILCWWPHPQAELIADLNEKHNLQISCMDSGLIEIKTESTSSILSPEQRTIRRRVNAMGGKFAVARNYQTVRDTLIGWGVKCQNKIILAQSVL